ncbi:MAG: hypothetical protein ABEJ58_06935 [Halodesulfurarchaeum sp.]
MDIEFDQSTQTATFYSPLEDFEETTVDVTIRTDPLTGEQSRIVPESFVLPDSEPDIEEVIANDEGCFFCPDMVEDATPMYPDFVGVDRGHEGEATSFPNLNPYGSHSNVVVLTDAHYVPLGDFTEDIFQDGFRAAIDYLTAVFEHDPEATIGSINMNYLRPAGSSIVHPHLQTVVDDRGTNAQRRRLSEARTYDAESDGDFFGDLAATEEQSPRFIGRTDAVEWIAPFAPRHHRHVLGIGKTVDVPDADSEMIDGIASGVQNVLSYYDDVGLNSFNLAVHLVQDEPAMRPIVDVVARSVFDRYYWSDATFFETIHREAIVDVSPETYASEAAEFF